MRAHRHVAVAVVLFLRIVQHHLARQRAQLGLPRFGDVVVAQVDALQRAEVRAFRQRLRADVADGAQRQVQGLQRAQPRLLRQPHGRFVADFRIAQAQVAQALGTDLGEQVLVRGQAAVETVVVAAQPQLQVLERGQGGAGDGVDDLARQAAAFDRQFFQRVVRERLQFQAGGAADAQRPQLRERGQQRVVGGLGDPRDLAILVGHVAEEQRGQLGQPGAVFDQRVDVALRALVVGLAPGADDQCFQFGRIDLGQEVVEQRALALFAVVVLGQPVDHVAAGGRGAHAEFDDAFAAVDLRVFADGHVGLLACVGKRGRSIPKEQGLL